MKIISVSRRTDIPAFYTDWFINRLRAGYVYVKHPYSGKWIHVSLSPSEIGAIVFWSKDFSPLIRKLGEIEEYTKNLFFHFTITTNQTLEPGPPSSIETLKDCIYLSTQYSPDQIVWRFDPICITDKMDFDIYKEWYIQCCEALKGYVRMCYLSFAHPYKKVLKNFETYSDHTFLEVPRELKRQYANTLATIASTYGIRVFACCNNDLLSDKIHKGRCIDGSYLSRIFRALIDTKNAPTRKECACTRSIDIGAYDTCIHGCLYCYANSDKDKALGAYQHHNPKWNSLIGEVSPDMIA